MVTYPYASGNLLEDRNTYFYTPYGGREFLEVWRQERDATRSLLGTEVALPIFDPGVSLVALERQISDGETVETKILLESLHYAFHTQDTISKEMTKLVDRVMKKFEVTKRIHEAYSSGFRAVNKHEHNNLDLYVHMAAVFEASYSSIKKLPYLNVFLKNMDTLCALQARLDQNQKSNLAWLIDREKYHIHKLSLPEEVQL